MNVDLIRGLLNKDQFNSPIANNIKMGLKLPQIIKVFFLSVSFVILIVNNVLVNVIEIQNGLECFTRIKLLSN